ncbi:MAG: glycosyltransferase family 2 protein [Acidobacteria bacterium]|nr:MAG: glycosyltransferase family 2 protein [Acidobacteriota bacterium]
MREGGPVSDRPFVTVAIPCLNVEACIRGVLDQDYPADRLEILVADGGSGDGTRSILARLAAEHPRLRVIDNPDRIQAAGLNASVKVARGEVIVRMDAHCEYQRDYLSRCVEALEATGADNVGGAQRAQARTFFQRALCAALRSPLGVGGARYRSAENEGFVDTVFLGAFRRRVFETVGLYDSRAVTNEDAELNQRLLAAGGRIYLSRDIVVHYYPRATLPALLKHRTLPSLRPALPFFMLAAAAALLAIPSLRPLIPLSFALYALATGTEALRVGRRLGAATAALVWAIFPVLHVCHGLGFAAGLLRYAAGPDWAPPERLSRPDLTCS